MDVLQQAGEAVGQGIAQWAQQVIPVGLHVLACPPLGIAFTAHILVVRGDYVGDEVVVTTGCLEREERRFNYKFVQLCANARCKRSPGGER